ncbi:hypothetical protein SLE2022_217660 [Rubroshorea leprosula]
MVCISIERPRLESLKDLTSMPGPRSPCPQYPGFLKTRYVKVKEPVFRNGVRVYWDEVPLHKEVGDEESEVRCFGVFRFLKVQVIGTIRRAFDRYFGVLLGLPMSEYHGYDLRDSAEMTSWKMSRC